ncbi:CAP domain-containing protein [Isosphaeraceae bacterium EP7]
MTRMSVRHQPLMENLESRQVLSSGGPTAEAQYMLELVNAARSNAGATIDRLTTKLDDQTVNTLAYYKVNLQAEKQAIASITPRAPLAWSDKLAAAATAHSQDQAANGFQSHTGSDGSSSNDRITRTGLDASATSENAYAYADSVDDSMRAFLIDWGVDSKGHRNNLLQTNSSDQSFDEIGLGIVKSNKPGFGPLVVTQDMARSTGDKSQVLGVVYDDKNGNNFYTPGEGASDVTIQAKNVSTGKVSQVQTWDSGGYQIPLDPGTYQVSATDGSKLIGSQSVNIQSSNVKVDFRIDQSQAGDATPPVTIAKPVSVIQPVRAQAAVASPVKTAVVTPVKTPVVVPVKTPVVTPVVAAVVTPAVTPVVPPVSTTPTKSQTPDTNASQPISFRDSTLAPLASANSKPSASSFDPSWITSWSNWKPSAKAKV